MTSMASCLQKAMDMLAVCGHAWSCWNRNPCPFLCIKFTASVAKIVFLYPTAFNVTSKKNQASWNNSIPDHHTSTRATRQVLLVEQELFTLQEHLGRSLFVSFAFLFWPLYCLSFDLRLLITPLVSSNSSSITWCKRCHKGVYVVNPISAYQGKSKWIMVYLSRKHS